MHFQVSNSVDIRLEEQVLGLLLVINFVYLRGLIIARTMKLESAFELIIAQYALSALPLNQCLFASEPLWIGSVPGSRGTGD